MAPPRPNFLSGIAGGAATLKKAPARPAPPQGLLAGIKGGAATLRHASQRKLKPVQKQGDLMSEIATKLAERRGRIAAMQRHESDSDDEAKLRPHPQPAVEPGSPVRAPRAPLDEPPALPRSRT